MQSDAKTISAYLKEVPADRREVLTKLHHTCLEILKGYEESMEYGMACYKKNSIGEVAFASQKNYISFYILKLDVVKKNKSLLKNLNVGKSCIRFSKPEKIDFSIIKKLLIDTFNSTGKTC